MAFLWPKSWVIYFTGNKWQETYDGGSAVYPEERIGATNKDLIGSNCKACSDEAKATERRIEVVLMPVHVWLQINYTRKPAMGQGSCKNLERKWIS